MARMEDTMKRLYSLAFLQGSEAEDLSAIIDADGPEAALKQMIADGYGDVETNLNRDWNDYDMIRQSYGSPLRMGKYVLAYYTRMPWVGLSVWEEEPDVVFPYKVYVLMPGGHQSYAGLVAGNPKTTKSEWLAQEPFRRLLTPHDETHMDIVDGDVYIDALDPAGREIAFMITPDHKTDLQNVIFDNMAE